MVVITNTWLGCCLDKIDGGGCYNDIVDADSQSVIRMRWMGGDVVDDGDPDDDVFID